MSLIKNNEGFCCIYCNRDVPLAQKRSRNHCPYCFASQHVDTDIPGDRKSNCKGMMIPFEYILKHDEFRLHFICTVCKKEHRNQCAPDDVIDGLEGCIQGYRGLL